MPQEKKPKARQQKNDNSRPRNESTPTQSPVGTSSPEPINKDNSPEVRDALNESQL